MHKNKPLLSMLMAVVLTVSQAMPVSAAPTAINIDAPAVRTTMVRTGHLGNKSPAASEGVSSGVSYKLDIKYKDAGNKPTLQAPLKAVAGIVTDQIPRDMVKYFCMHHGIIYVDVWHGGGGYTLLAADDGNKPHIPDTLYEGHTMDMVINGQDLSYGYLDDYVIHEFGHVFDARYGITSNPEYDAIVTSEMPGVVKANELIYTDPAHFSTTPEAFAQVYAAYIGGNGIEGGAETLMAAPKTVEIIKKFEGRA